MSIGALWEEEEGKPPDFCWPVRVRLLNMSEGGAYDWVVVDCIKLTGAWLWGVLYMKLKPEAA